MAQKIENCCCCQQEAEYSENCLVCGKPLVYFTTIEKKECCICHKVKDANASCEDGHFVCDECHVSGAGAVISYLLQTDEKDPITLYLNVCKLKSVHLHGPEHHSIVPCVLLAAYHNCGGDIELSECLNEAWVRGKKMSGGACGFLGVCGAAAGAGIFASIVSDASPLTPAEWEIPQRLTARCLERMCDIGGPRCCKRTGRIAIECAAQYSAEVFGVTIPVSSPGCTFSDRNKECLHEKCPFYAR